jgi:hypothetical protein
MRGIFKYARQSALLTFVGHRSCLGEVTSQKARVDKTSPKYDVNISKSDHSSIPVK